MLIRWNLTSRGNYTAVWCGKRCTIYPRKRGGWGVVLDGDFLDATWIDKGAAMEWAAEALQKLGDADEGEKPQLPPPPPPVKFVSSRTHRRDWRPQADTPWWYRELGMTRMDVDEVKSRFKTLARKHHPDVGGKTEDMEALNRAYESAISFFLNSSTPGAING